MPCPPPGNLPNSGIEPRSPTLQDFNGQCYSDGPSSPTYSIFLSQKLPRDLLTCTEAPLGTEKASPVPSRVSPACLRHSWQGRVLYLACWTVSSVGTWTLSWALCSWLCAQGPALCLAHKHPISVESMSEQMNKGMNK